MSLCVPLPTPSPVLLGGSRSLSPRWARAVWSLVALLRRAGCGVSVGCAAGADALAVSACLGGFPSSRWSLFCVGAASGAGFWSGSAPLGLLRQAAAAGVPVVWSAGGGPSVPPRARLLRRSLAALAGCQLGVWFLASPVASGSLAVAAQAARRGVSVAAVACGFAGAPAPLAGAGGWVAGSLCGWRPPAGVSVWFWLRAAPAQPLLF